MQRHTEETFNRALADALCAVNQHWEREECYVEELGLIDGKPTLRPDILICERDAPPVIIECSYDSSDANHDAIRRIGLRLASDGREISAVISIAIPRQFRKMQQAEAARQLQEGEEFGMALYRYSGNGPVRFPDDGHIPARLDSLSDMIAVAAATGERVVELANEVSQRIKQAANIMADIPDEPRQQIAATMQHNVLNGLQVVCLMWMNALLVQNQLHREGHHNVGPVVFDPARQPVSAEYLTQWRQILGINWRAIFQPAVNSLSVAVNYEPEMRGVMERLIGAVQSIETARLGRHINIGAELFPILSADRKEAAAFYTNSSTAEFLARMTIREDTLYEDDWRSDDIYQNHRLADLACGTGTLLRTGHKRIMSLVRHAGRLPDNNMYRQAMEQGLIGVDISPIAAHLTASSLGMLGRNEPYEQTNIGWVGVGQPIAGSPGRATIGSLEYLAQDSVENFLDEGIGYGQADGQVGVRHDIGIDDDSIGWILMNPPYSRTRGRQRAFDVAGLTDALRKQCQRRWGDVIKGLPAIKTAGMGASYLVLARQKVRPGGRIGFVLPLTAAFAESWARTRVMIETEFTDIVVITVAGGHHAGELSADTGMNEMMLVATRKTADMGPTPSPVHCATLNVAPTHNGIAGELARAVETAVDRFDDEDTLASEAVMCATTRVGSVVRLAGTGQGVPWFPLGAVSTSFSFFAWYLVRGRYLDGGMETTPFNVPMTTIGDLFDVGPTHDELGYPRDGSERGAFVVDPVPEGQHFGHDRMLWANNANIQTSLVVGPTHRGIPRPGENLHAIRRTAGTLFYNKNLRWTSQKLVAASTDRLTMGGRSWISLGHPDVRVRKAAALWFNSLFGMTVQWARGQRTHQGRSTAQVKAVKEIPVPQLDLLPNDVLEEAAGFFDHIRGEQLLRLMLASEDNVRGQIDMHVCRLMGLAQAEVQDELIDLRDLFCREPTAHG